MFLSPPSLCWIHLFVNPSDPDHFKRLLSPKDSRGRAFMGQPIMISGWWISWDTDTVWGTGAERCPDLSLDSVPFLNPDIWRKEKAANVWTKNNLRICSVVRKNLQLPTTTSRTKKQPRPPNNYTMDGRNPRRLQHGEHNCIITPGRRRFTHCWQFHLIWVKHRTSFSLRQRPSALWTLLITSSSFPNVKWSMLVCGVAEMKMRDMKSVHLLKTHLWHLTDQSDESWWTVWLIKGNNTHIIISINQWSWMMLECSQGDSNSHEEYFSKSLKEFDVKSIKSTNKVSDAVSNP